MKRLIITGDDFGLARPVNEAIAEAHRRGILSTASLMVGAGACQDAVERARSLPSLHVGLHLVLVEGAPVLPAPQVPALVDGHGEFSTRLVLAGFNFFFRPGVRKQLELEIGAQFEAFRRTGLALDHVNTHNHMHVHPTILGLILKIGRDYGLASMRFPNEPALLSWRASRRALPAKVAAALFLLPWMKLMKARLHRARIKYNDFVFGMADSGSMTADLIRRFLKVLPDGITEMYFHPATARCPEIDRTMRGYRHEEEFRALTDVSVIEALRATGASKIAFSDL